MFEKLIGLSFVSAISDILLSGSSFKKYIKSVIGAVFVLTVISGFASVEEINFELPEIKEEDTSHIYEEELRKEVGKNTSESIKKELSRNGIEVSHITIDFKDGFYIKKISLSLKNYSKDEKRAIELLVNYFKIDKEVISICQG